ncbi:unnamed protein product [Miscanthus lutarioriparius]|uniref:Uncharacterized protein n=1 Tax=Miscanthus lutarioriparius TaxID=422564 RepID=A0A811RSM9_9POAL|nr:unnamed protein product [Miscanthus lutarioriparius]
MDSPSIFRGSQSGPIFSYTKTTSHCCREEWISGMVIALSTYLVKEIFPKQIELLQESSSSSDAGSTAYQARVSWLSLVDLMISFDKRIQGLISGTGLLLTVKDDDSWQRISVLCVFCDCPDWLQVWAEIERQESLNKLQSAMDLEKNWSARIQGTMLEYDSDDCKSPLITSAVHQTLSLLIDRARPAVSRTFIESLDYMQGQLSKLQGGLNTVDFVTVWRSVASGVDQLLFGGIFTSGIKISSDGVERLQGDLSVLFAIFSAWCLRPEGFFPRLSEGLRLLKIDEQQLKDGGVYR